MESTAPTARSIEAVYRALVESTTDQVIAVVDPDLNVRFVNPAVRATLGWLPDELVGEPSRTLVHAEDHALAVSMLAEATTTNEPTAPTLLRTRHRDGTWVYLEIVVQSRLSDPAIEGVLIHGRDVTSQMRGAARLQQSETRLREIFESVHDGLFLFDATSARVIEGNRALCTFLGYDRHELIALGVVDLFPEPSAWEQAAREPGGERRSLEGVALRRRDGSIRYADLALTTLELPGSDPIIVTVVRDVTERREAERMKELFFAVVAHELRSPVAVLKSSVSLLRSSGELSEADRADLLAMHHEEVERLARIVADGLDFSAVHAGTLRVTLTPTPLEPILRGLANRSSMHGGRAVDLHVEALVGQVDPGRFEQVVTNLIDNAFRHATTAPRVSLRLVKEGGFARVSVEDDGPGIPASLRTTLFDRYYLVSDRPTRGMGIGLWLSKRFVDAMGGTIEAEEAAGGGGSRVSFTVPLAP